MLTAVQSLRRSCGESASTGPRGPGLLGRGWLWGFEIWDLRWAWIGGGVVGRGVRDEDSGILWFPRHGKRGRVGEIQRIQAMTTRRRLFSSLPIAAALPGVLGSGVAAEPVVARKPLRIGVSTYSFWHFDEKTDVWRSMEKCLETAADMGFDGVELLQVQMTDTSPAALRKIKQRAFSLGLDLMGFSTHQGFCSPDAQKRDDNVLKTTQYLEQAYDLGIPTIRVNTGRWGTSKNFDELMANRGIEPRLEGYTDDDGFKWVIDSFEKLVAEAEKRGVVMGLENHWGLGISAEGVLRIVDAVKSPWLKVTLDTGNFLEDPYDRLKKLAPQTVLLQAKTYHGGGMWYSLDLDYGRIAAIMREAGYRGYVSLEMEGKEDPLTAVPKSLAMLRQHFS